MTWAKLDDGFADHPKIESLTDAAFRAFVTSLCYSAQHMTDGRLSRARVQKIAKPKVESELLDAGLWEPREAGVEIHDFLKYHPSRAQVLAEREAAAERQRKWRESHRDKRETNSGGDAVSSAAPTRPDPKVLTSSSVSTSDVPVQVWMMIAERRANGQQIQNRPRWLATVAQNAMNDERVEAERLWSSYVLTPGQLADVIVAGAANSQVLKYAERRGE